MKIGTRVKVERDEKKYPPRGVWKSLRGKKGTVTGTTLGEIWVELDNGELFWFHRHELKEIK